LSTSYDMFNATVTRCIYTVAERGMDRDRWTRCLTLRVAHSLQRREPRQTDAMLSCSKIFLSANQLRAQVNSASYPHRDGKLVVALIRVKS